MLSIVAQGVNSGLEALDSRRLIGSIRSSIFEEGRNGSSGIMAPSMLFGLDNPVFHSFAVCAGVLGAKLALNSAWTVWNRTQRKVTNVPHESHRVLIME